MSSTAKVYVTELEAFLGDTAVLDDALTDAALGLDSELLTDCMAGAQTDSIFDNQLLSGAAGTLLPLLPDHLREWEGATDAIANLLAPRVSSALFAGMGALSL